MATTRQKNNGSAANMPMANEAEMKTEEIKDGVKEAAAQIKGSAGEMLGQAKETVGQVAGQAQEKAKSQLADRKDQVAEGLDHVAAALRKTGDQLQDQNMGPVNDYVNKAANTLSDISTYVRDNNVDDILRGVEQFARREPVLTLGSAFAVGLMAARFLKSSNQRRPSYMANNDWRAPGGNASSVYPYQDQNQNMWADAEQNGNNMGNGVGSRMGDEMSRTAQNGGRTGIAEE